MRKNLFMLIFTTVFLIFVFGVRVEALELVEEPLVKLKNNFPQEKK